MPAEDDDPTHVDDDGSEDRAAAQREPAAERRERDAAKRKRRWMPGVKDLPSSKIPRDRLPGGSGDDADGDGDPTGRGAGRAPDDAGAVRRPGPEPEPEDPRPRSMYRRENEARAAEAAEAAKARAAAGADPADGSADGPGGADSAVARLGVGFDKERVREVIGRHFRVYDERDALPGLRESVLVAYFVMGAEERLDDRYEAMRQELLELDDRLIPMLRVEGGETIVVMTRRGREPSKKRALPRVLFAVTLVSMVLSGALAWVAYHGNSRVMDMFLPESLLFGAISFALPLFLILVVQDLARRVVARRHHVRLGMSWWVPVPPLLFIPSIGAFGSVAESRDPFPDRKALFDVAVSGPIAGFLAALPVIVIGLMLTTAVAVPVPDGNDLALTITAPDGETRWVQDEHGALDGPASTATTGGDPGSDTDPDTDLDSDADDTSRRPPPVFSRDDPRRTGYGGEIGLRADIQVREGIAFVPGTWNLTLRSTGTTGDPIEYDARAFALAPGGELLQNVTWNGSVAPDTASSEHWNLTDVGDVARIIVEVEFTLADETTVQLGEPAAFQFIYDIMGRDDGVVIHPTALAGWTGLMLMGIALLPIGRLDGGMIARAIMGDSMIWLSYAGLGLLVVLSCAYMLWIHLALFILLFIGTRHPPPLNDTTPLDGRRLGWAAVAVVVFLASFVWVPAEVATLDLCARFLGH